MNEAVIVAAARTPIGRARKGSLATTDAWRLAEIAISAVVDRAGVPVSEIADLILAESLQGGGVIGRNVAVRLGMLGVPGAAVNRQCASGITSIQFAAATIMAGMEQVIIAGGTESGSTMPMTLKPGPSGDLEPWMPQSHPTAPGIPSDDMSITIGENIARLRGVTRHDADSWAARSHQRAVKAIEKGYFEDEIVGVPVSSADGDRIFAVDEHPRADTTVETLAGLKLIHPELPGAVVTAGNSSGVNDAAAAVMIVSADYAATHGLTPMARIRGWASVGVPVVETGLAPTLAIPKAVQRSGISMADLDLIEINEAFATMAVACTRDLGLDESMVNVNGSGCSLGHPIAATGTRMVVSTINELARRDRTFGVISMCAGGGMGSALVIERV